jgi:hypothetical protein
VDFSRLCFQASRLVVLFGAYALVDGIFNVIAFFSVASHQWALLVEGVIGIIAGILTFAWPPITAIVLLYMIVSWAIFTGTFEISRGIRLRKAVTNEWLLPVMVVLSVLFGVRTPSLSFSSLAIRSLAPGRMVVNHLANQSAQVSQALDNDQSLTPIKEPGEQDHERACGSGRTSRLLNPFLKQSELFAKKQFLGDDGSARGKEQADQQQQGTFYRSLRDHLRPSERSALFFA